jgi:hypothetical protein
LAAVVLTAVYGPFNFPALFGMLRVAGIVQQSKNCRGSRHCSRSDSTDCPSTDLRRRGRRAHPLRRSAAIQGARRCFDGSRCRLNRHAYVHD